MTPNELKTHKKHKKVLDSLPSFNALSKRGSKLPRPLDGLGRRKDVYVSGLIEVSNSHAVFFLYRDGQILTDRAFFGYLFCVLQNKSLNTLYEFHWHPSHKGIHCKLQCNTSLNYTGRLLVQAPELQLAPPSELDPAKEADRVKLVQMFCAKCGIHLNLPKAQDQDQASEQGDLFNELDHQ